MKLKLVLTSILGLAVLLIAPALPVRAQEPPPVVHAVLFYSPTCGHCEYVIKEVFPPLYEQYGSQLQILGFDVTSPKGQEMFRSALERFGMEQAGVPFLVIDNITLVGSEQIPEEFPGLIEAYMKLGGAQWPDIPGLREMLIAAAQAATAQPSESQDTAPAPAAPASTPLGWRERFAADAAANTIAVVVLVVMIAAVVWAVILFRRGSAGGSTPPRLTGLIPVLCALGLIVAGYLAYIEATGQQAVCGPLGDCNSVQQSPYARLFGVFSIGALGLVGFLGIGAAWTLARFTRGRTAQISTLALFAIALAATLFSIYLTFLEPFVIGATCAWCLTSAVLTTVLMLLSAGPAGRALAAASTSSPPPSPRPRQARAARAR